MSYEAMKTPGGSLNAYYQVKKSQSEKSTYCMPPTIKHSGKGKTVNKKDQWLPRVERGSDEQAEHRDFFSS